MTLTIIGLDPGGTTGWAVMSLPRFAMDAGEFILPAICNYNSGEIRGDEMSQVDQMMDLAHCWPGAAFVIESFTMRTLAADLSPVRISNAFEYGLRTGHFYLEDFEPGPMFKQAPALAKTTITDERLQSYGYGERTVGKPHARDATRHALTFLRRAKSDLRLAARAWPLQFNVLPTQRRA